MPWLVASDLPACRAWAELEILGSRAFAELERNGVVNDEGEPGAQGNWRTPGRPGRRSDLRAFVSPRGRRGKGSASEPSRPWIGSIPRSCCRSEAEGVSGSRGRTSRGIMASTALAPGRSGHLARVPQGPNAAARRQGRAVAPDGSAGVLPTPALHGTVSRPSRPPRRHRRQARPSSRCVGEPAASGSQPASARGITSQTPRFRRRGRRRANGGHGRPDPVATRGPGAKSPPVTSKFLDASGNTEVGHTISNSRRRQRRCVL
jgi:hypothetical protein